MSETILISIFFSFFKWSKKSKKPYFVQIFFQNRFFFIDIIFFVLHWPTYFYEWFVGDTHSDPMQQIEQASPQ